ncbi:hypothetical protein AN640_05965, partial [Candidatus Epulonipiscium fishelsonii]
MIEGTDNKINIVLFKYDLRMSWTPITNKFIEELEIAFKNMGHIVTIIDFDKYMLHKNSMNLCYVINSDGISIVFEDREQSTTDFDYGLPKGLIKVDYVINFCFTLAFIPSLLKIFSDNNVIVGTLLLDNPARQACYGILSKNVPKKNIFVGMFAESFLNSYEKYIDNTGILTHLMQAGSKALNNKKNIDVIMTANLIEPDLPEDRINKLIEKKEIKESEITIFKKFAKEVYDKAFSDFNKTMEECMEEVILENEDIQLAMNILDLKQILFEGVYREVDWCRRMKYRQKVVKALLDNDIEVEFWLNSKNKLFNEYPNFKDNGKLPYPEIVEKIAESKILLQDLYPVKNGGS